MPEPSLRISYTHLHNAGTAMQRIADRYRETTPLSATYNDLISTPGSPSIRPIVADVRRLVADDLIAALGDEELVRTTQRLMQAWCRPLGMALGKMHTTGSYFLKVSDAYFSADAQVAADLARQGFDPVSLGGALNQYQSAHQQWAEGERRRGEYERRVADWRRDHPGQELPPELRDEHYGLVAQYDRNGTVVGWAPRPEPMPPGVPPITPGSVVTRAAQGRPISVTTDGITGTITYDGAGRPSGTTLSDGNHQTTTAITYNADGSVREVSSTVEDASSHQRYTSTTTYTDWAHYTTVNEGPDGSRTTHETTVAGTPSGNRTTTTKTTDSEGKVTTTTNTVAVSPNADGIHEDVTETTTYTDGTTPEVKHYQRPAQNPNYFQLYR